MSQTPSPVVIPEDETFLSDEDIFAQEVERREGLEPLPQGAAPQEPASDDPPAAEAPPAPPAVDDDPQPPGEQPPAEPQGAAPVTPAVEAPPPAPAAAAPEPVTPAPPEEPAWMKDLSDEAKAHLTQVETDLATTQQQYNSLHGKVAPVQQENARLRQRLGNRQPAPAAPAPPPAGQITPPLETFDLGTMPEFKAYSEAFPEEAKAIGAVFQQQGKHIHHLNGQVQSVSRGLQDVQQDSLEREKTDGLSRLLAAHSDWQIVRPSEDYRQWLSSQPASIAELDASPDPEECIWILDRYKADRYIQRHLNGSSQPAAAQPVPPPPAAHPQRTHRERLRAVPSLEPQGGGMGVPMGGNPDDMLSDEEIWDREVERRLREQRNANR